MGRYTTVQAYSDSNPKVTKVSYEQASQSTDKNVTPSGKLVTEKVDNVMGSTAGAGSGEFHMYRASRRRELHRVAHMEIVAEENEAKQKLEETIKMKRSIEEMKTMKRAAKRQKRKKAKKGIIGSEKQLASTEPDENEGRDDTDEFSYEPVSIELRKPAVVLNGVEVDIPTDGSFIEKMSALISNVDKKSN